MLTKTNNIIAIDTSFEGATLGAYSVEGTTISATLREEPLVLSDGITHDYNWHFCFGIENKSDQSISVTVKINCADSTDMNTNAYILTQTEIDKDFYPLEALESKTDTYRKYYIVFSLLPGQKRYISNTYFRTLTNVMNTFDDLTGRHDTYQKRVFGSSIEGRDLCAYFISRPDAKNKPLVLITSGFHPMEADTYGSQAIMEYLCTEDGKKLLEICTFVFVPVVNPDGFVYGFNGCNAKGINLYWDFRIEDKEHAPETYALWQFVIGCMPNVYIDFHAYTFQLQRKKDAPYVKPSFCYASDNVKELALLMSQALISLHDGRAMKGQITFAPSTLSYRLTQELNTITFAKYHLHVSDGLEHMKSISKKIIECICDEFRNSKRDSRYELLYKPYGELPKEFCDQFCRKVRVEWYYTIKPILRKIINYFRR